MKSWMFSSIATLLNFFLLSPLPSDLSFQFNNFSETEFNENYLTSDFHANILLQEMFAYPSRWLPKP